MWFELDPEIKRQLAFVREQVARRHETPTAEWPLVVIDEHDLLLVIRERPNGDLTAFLQDTTADGRPTA
jgi:hypothetical protein